MAGLSKKGRELLTRSLSGALIVIAILGGVSYGGWLWGVMVTLVGVISLDEFYQLAAKRLKISKGIGLIFGAVILMAVGLGHVESHVILVSLALAFIAVLSIEMLRRQYSGISTAIENGAGTLAGLVFVILPWSFSVILRGGPYGKVLLLSVFLCTWACDVSAYIVGTLWGRHKLCDNISPNKTWEGFCSGVAGSFLMAAAIAYVRSFPPLPLLIVGLICGIAGQMGDLCESILKREASVKDTGKILPGHGGMLDRFDSVLISLTLVYFVFEVAWR